MKKKQYICEINNIYFFTKSFASKHFNAQNNLTIEKYLLNKSNDI